MIHVLYPHGGMGHTFMGLVKYCTKEGGASISEFKIHSSNQHHIMGSPLINVLNRTGRLVTKDEYNQKSPLVVSTSTSFWHQILIIEMGHFKTNFYFPPTEDNLIYSTTSASTLGEKLECVATGLRDVLNNKIDWWYIGAGKIFEISWYWNDRSAISDFLVKLNLTPIDDRLQEYADAVVMSNQTYFEKVKYYFDIIDKVVNEKSQSINLTFYETSLIYSMLLLHYKVEVSDNLCLVDLPTNTIDFFNIFHHRQLNI